MSGERSLLRWLDGKTALSYDSVMAGNSTSLLSWRKWSIQAFSNRVTSDKDAEDGDLSAHVCKQWHTCTNNTQATKERKAGAFQLNPVQIYSDPFFFLFCPKHLLFCIFFSEATDNIFKVWYWVNKISHSFPSKNVVYCSLIINKNIESEEKNGHTHN